MENKEIRLSNLMDLLKKHGTQKAFAEYTGMDPAHVSQIVNGNRNMGDKVARQIEEKQGLPLGYMDVFHDHQIPHIGVEETDSPRYLTEQEDIERFFNLAIDTVHEFHEKMGTSMKPSENHKVASKLFEKFVDQREFINKESLMKILEYSENNKRA